MVIWRGRYRSGGVLWNKSSKGIQRRQSKHNLLIVLVYGDSCWGRKIKFLINCFNVCFQITNWLIVVIISFAEIYRLPFCIIWIPLLLVDIDLIGNPVIVKTYCSWLHCSCLLAWIVLWTAALQFIVIKLCVRHLLAQAVSLTDTLIHSFYRSQSSICSTNKVN